MGETVAWLPGRVRFSVGIDALDQSAFLKSALKTNVAVRELFSVDSCVDSFCRM